MNDKARQKELHSLYYEEMLRCWHGDVEMATFCTKGTARIIETSNGHYITIDKPRIDTDFCFGYSDSRYDTEDFDRAIRMAEHAKTSELYFIRANLKQMKETLAILKSIQRGSRVWTALTQIHYSGSPPDTKAYAWSIIKSWNGIPEYMVEQSNVKEMDSETLDRLITGYKMEIVVFHKRLRTYLKRYGMSKVRTWTYWADR